MKVESREIHARMAALIAAAITAVLVAGAFALTPPQPAFAAGDSYAPARTGALSATEPAEVVEQAATMDLYRMYNPNSGEHFYTSATAERDYLKRVGWRYEGVGWVSPTSSSAPVYRLYSGTDHHYTTSAAERDWLVRVGWRYEGIGWYSDDTRRIPVYRQFNPNVNIRAVHNNSGSHNFTTSKEENDNLARVGWRAEGVAWYAAGAGRNDGDPVPNAAALRAKLNLRTDFRREFAHGFKGADYQAYIVLHDTEEWGNGQSVINMWDSRNNGVAAHFIVDRDGTVWQCVDMAQIAHHAGAGDAGNDRRYGVTDKSRDDAPAWNGDYGMNSYSIGIEISHVKGAESYPKAQLVALDNLIAYIDAYYGFNSTIIDHKMWRSGNPDTSPEFATYLANYRKIRRHA